MEEVANEHFSDFIRYHKGIAAYRNTKKPKFREVEVICLYGPAGTGKTRLVYEREPNLFICPDSTLQWFDGYGGEEAVLIDDFRGIPHQRVGFLLQLLDRYPLRVPVKGSFVQWNPSRIYITSNVAPPFDDELITERAPILRRIHKIINLPTPLTFGGEHYDYEYLFN